MTQYENANDTNGRVSVAQMMVYVSEQFDKLRAEMCDGFDKIGEQLLAAQVQFVTHNEVNAMFALMESRLDSAVSERNKLMKNVEDDVCAIQKDLKELERLVWKAVGIGMVVGILAGAIATNIMGHIWPV